MSSGLEQFVSSSPLTYLLVVGAVAVDAVFPLIPAETILITAAVLAVDGKLVRWLLIFAALLGGVLGDSASYGLGRWVGEPAAKRLLRGEKGTRRLDWARGVIDRHGGWLVVAARFIPGARTAVTFASGTMEMPWRRRCLPADACGSFVWAVYITLLGYFGGRPSSTRRGSRCSGRRYRAGPLGGDRKV